MAYFNLFENGRGEELKRQLVRSAIAATEAIWEVLPDARMVHCDSMICVQARSEHPQNIAPARDYTNSQYSAGEMIAGRINSELGGQEKYFDIAGASCWPIYTRDCSARF